MKKIIFIIIIALVIIAGINADKLINKNSQFYTSSLRANLSWTPFNPKPNEVVIFDASSSIGNIVLYKINFGDYCSYIGDNPIVSHIYTNEGKYTIYLEVTDDTGAKSVYVGTITVSQEPIYVDKEYMSQKIIEVYDMIDFTKMPKYEKGKNYINIWFRSGDTANFRYGNIVEGFYWSVAFIISNPSVVYYYLSSRSGGYHTDYAPKIVVDYSISNLPLKSENMPIADAGGPYYGYAGEPITFDASLSYDPDGYIVEYKWDFGVAWEENDIAYGKIVQYTYALANYEGQYYFVTLTVKDNDGNIAVAYTRAYVRPPEYNKYPVAEFTFAPQNPLVNEVVTFDASMSYDEDGSIRGYTFDFGDGNMTSGPNCIVTHKYERAGNYTVTLSVTDNYNAETTTSKQISIYERPQEIPTPPAKKDILKNNSLILIILLISILMMIYVFRK